MDFKFIIPGVEFDFYVFVRVVNASHHSYYNFICLTNEKSFDEKCEALEKFDIKLSYRIRRFDQNYNNYKMKTL
jgi:hypothetical protein